MQNSIEKPLKISILLKTFRDPGIPGNENQISRKKHFPEKVLTGKSISRKKYFPEKAYPGKSISRKGEALLYSNDSLLKFLIIIVDVSKFF
jgi:hypothetical protein